MSSCEVSAILCNTNIELKDYSNIYVTVSHVLHEMLTTKETANYQTVRKVGHPNRNRTASSSCDQY